MGAYTNHQDPGNNYVLITSQKGWKQLEKLRGVSQKDLYDVWKSIMCQYSVDLPFVWCDLNAKWFANMAASRFIWNFLTCLLKIEVKVQSFVASYQLTGCLWRSPVSIASSDGWRWSPICWEFCKVEIGLGRQVSAWLGSLIRLLLYQIYRYYEISLVILFRKLYSGWVYNVFEM